MSAPSSIRPQPADLPAPPPVEKRAKAKLSSSLTPREKYIYYYVLYELKNQPQAALDYLSLQNCRAPRLSLLKGRQLEDLYRKQEAVDIYVTVPKSYEAYRRWAHIECLKGDLPNSFSRNTALLKLLAPFIHYPFMDFSSFIASSSALIGNGAFLAGENKKVEALQSYMSALEMINYAKSFSDENESLPEMSKLLEKSLREPAVDSILGLKIYNARTREALEEIEPLTQKISIPEKKLLAEEKDIPFVFYAIGRLLEEDKSMTAYRLLKMNESLLENYQDYWMFLGWAAAATFQRTTHPLFCQAAEMAYMRVLEDEPEHPGARYSLAYLYFLQGKLEDAARTLRPLLEQEDKLFGLSLQAAIEWSRSINSCDRRP